MTKYVIVFGVEITAAINHEEFYLEDS